MELFCGTQNAIVRVSESRAYNFNIYQYMHINYLIIIVYLRKWKWLYKWIGRNEFKRSEMRTLIKLREKSCTDGIDDRSLSKRLSLSWCMYTGPGKCRQSERQIYIKAIRFLQNIACIGSSALPIPCRQR